MKRLISIILALLVIGISPVVSFAGELEDAQEDLRLYPNHAKAHHNLGVVYGKLGHYQDAIAPFKEAIRINPGYTKAYYNLGVVYGKLGHYQDAIASLKEAIRINPDHVDAHNELGITYYNLGHYQDAIASLKEAIRINPDHAHSHNNLGITYGRLGQLQEAITEYKAALRINPDQKNAKKSLNKLERRLSLLKLAKERLLLKEERKKHEARLNTKEANRLKQERRLLEEERKKWEDLRLAEENRKQQPSTEQSLHSGTGSGFFISKMGHVITNAHVVRDCNRITLGDNANHQAPAKVIRTDRRNDLALLKLSTLEMTSAESKSLIQKLSIEVLPLTASGLLRSEDVRLGEKVMVAGYPLGDFISNTMKVTTGVVSATLGAGNDSGQFQLDAAIQPGNSGGPIYDYGGNIVGVVVSQLNKLRMAEAIGTIPENQNFGVKASTVRQFLDSSGLPSKKAERAEDKSTEELAGIAKNQALMVMCFQ